LRNDLFPKFGVSNAAQREGAMTACQLRASQLASSAASHRLHTARTRPNKNTAGGNAMEQIRVCTCDGPGAQPVIRTVPWPKIPKKGALIKVGACGVCGTDLHILTRWR
jgi:hypothetical protein